MSGHGLITELDPVIIRRVVGLLPDDVMAAQLAATAAHMDSCAAAGRRVVTIVDLSEAERAPAIQRKMQSDWIAEHAALLARVSLGTAFVVPSALIRGALTAIFWVHPPPHPHTVLGAFDEALDWALARLDEAGIRRPPRLDTAEGRGAARIMGSAQGARAEPRRASGGSRRW